MNASRKDWEDRLAELRELTASDFCAAAHFDAPTRRIRWFAASGQSNERFLSMSCRSGQGLTGEAIRYGRTIQRTYADKEEIRAEDSIMHAERLFVAAAAPAGEDRNCAKGVLLIGRRMIKEYSKQEIADLEKAADCLFQDS